VAIEELFPLHFPALLCLIKLSSVLWPDYKTVPFSVLNTEQNAQRERKTPAL